MLSIPHIFYKVMFFEKEKFFRHGGGYFRLFVKVIHAQGLDFIFRLVLY